MKSIVVLPVILLVLLMLLMHMDSSMLDIALRAVGIYILWSTLVDMFYFKKFSIPVVTISATENDEYLWIRWINGPLCVLGLAVVTFMKF